MILYLVFSLLQARPPLAAHAGGSQAHRTANESTSGAACRRRGARCSRPMAVGARTDSVAERALRPAELWRKGSFGSDSEAGSRFAERLLTVVASCRQQGRSLLAFLVAAGEAALRGSPPPSLLAAPLES